MRDFARAFYKSQAWKQMRDYVYRRDGGLCRDCWDRGMLTPAEEVHHIIPITPDNITDEAITLNPDNLVSLCRGCHQQRHSSRAIRYAVDEFGRVIIKR